MATVAAADAGKIKVQIPAAEELASPFADDGPPSAVAPMVTVVVSPSYKKKSHCHPVCAAHRPSVAS